MNEYHEKPGLHVITLYAQIHNLSEVEELVTKHNIKYPVALDFTWSSGYQTDNMPLPKVWIVGTDGLVKFAGFGGYSKILEGELAKVKYPGLGKESVADALKPAAKLFADGKFAEARKAAEAIYDDTEDEATEDDADWIMKRIDERAESLRRHAESAEVEKRYASAISAWQELARYAGISEAEGAAKHLEKLKSSEDVRKEQAAHHKLISEMTALNVHYLTIDAESADDVRKFREKCLETYKKFAAEHKGTASAAKAEELIEVFKGLLNPPKEDEAPKDTPKEE